MKQLKSTFNSYNLFLDVILLQNMVNVLLIAQILRFHHQNERVRICQYNGENGSAWSAILRVCRSGDCSRLMQGIYQDKCFQVNLKGSLFKCIVLLSDVFHSAESKEQPFSTA